jgi:CheY-like chemotaxis protein
MKCPLKNGLEILKEVREQNNQIPFILFTGKGREDVAVKALNLGADGYLNKNGSPETVCCELAHAINKSVEAKKAGEILEESEQKYVGRPTENKKLLFKEGFSTSGSTSYGLFLIKKMVDVYGWQIKENGEPSKGAKFTMTIPKFNSNGKENFRLTK